MLHRPPAEDAKNCAPRCSSPTCFASERSAARAQRGPCSRASASSRACLEDETGWISVAAAQRALSALATALGENAIIHRGEWMTHLETLGAYVRMLRVASEPLDAYRYLTAN